MNSFQSTSINVNFFTGAVTSGRLAFGGSAPKGNSASNAPPAADANQVALGRMREALEAVGIRLNPSAQPRSAADVATQVLERVSTVLNSESNPEARIALLEKVADGIAQGIGEARQILGQPDAPGGKAVEKVDSIVERLQSGLQALAENISPIAPVNRVVVPDASETTAPALDPTPAAGNQLNASAGLLVQRSASISIETQDGDVISLDFNRSAALAVAVEMQTGPKGESVNFASARVVSSDLNYSVQGKLDEGEVEALDELLTKINKVADKFFDGQLAAAFKKASHLELDTEELSGYSIALESVVVKQIVSRYQTVAELGNADTGAAANDANIASGNPTTETNTPQVADAATAVGEVARVVDLAAQQRIIADPKTTVPNLIETVAQAKGLDATINPAGQSFAEALGLLRDLIADLVLPASKGEAESGESEGHHQQGDDRDDE